MKRKKTAIMKKEGGREQSRDRRKIKMPEDGKMDQTKKVLCRVLMASLLVAAYFGKTCYIHRSYQEDIAKRVLRFHVLANSDSQADQALKYAVRDRVGTMMAEKLQNVDSLEESTDVVTENLQEIETCAAKVIGENGYDYPVHAALETCAFPEKSYGDYTFPSGTYEALRVVIGSGEGHNWWCVMYPNLCFANSMYEVDSASGEKMREVLEPEEYAAVLESGNYKVRFKMLGFLNRMLE
jgi:stage II sporulation protein R